MRTMTMNRKKIRGAFGLVELLIVLAIVGAGLVLMLNRSDRADRISAANELAEDVPIMVSKIKGLAGASNSYTSVTAQRLSQWSVLPAKIKWDGAALNDPFGNAMTVNGNTNTFAITIGGATAALDQEVCSTVASRLAGGANAVRIGTAATATSGTISGGNVYKAVGGTPDAAALATGCSEATPVIAFQFR